MIQTQSTIRCQVVKRVGLKLKCLMMKILQHYLLLVQLARIPESAGAVTFDIIAELDPRRALAVRYAPAEVASGDFLDESTIPNQEAITTQTLNFAPTGHNDRYSAELVVPIHDDNVGERTGAIQVTILTDDLTNSYVVASDGSGNSNSSYLG